MHLQYARKHKIVQTKRRGQNQVLLIAVVENEVQILFIKLIGSSNLEQSFFDRIRTLNFLEIKILNCELLNNTIEFVQSPFVQQIVDSSKCNIKILVQSILIIILIFDTKCIQFLSYHLFCVILNNDFHVFITFSIFFYFPIQFRNLLLLITM